MEKTEMRKMDWHLFWTAAAIIVPICGVVLSCFMSLKSDINLVKNEINQVKTVLILKGIMPECMAKQEVQK